MKVAELQSFLRNLSSFVGSTGGGQVAKELERVTTGLDHFQSMSVADFADFLARAEEFARTGVVGTKATKARQPRQPAKSSEDVVKEAVQLVSSLYEKALDADFRYEGVDEQLVPLKKLTVAQLKMVAKELDIADVPRKKDDIVAEMGRKIKGRREFHDRMRMNAAATTPS